MDKIDFQYPELKDENGNIIQVGSFSPDSMPLTNSSHTGYLDYVDNDLVWLYEHAGSEVVEQLNAYKSSNDAAIANLKTDISDRVATVEEEMDSYKTEIDEKLEELSDLNADNILSLAKSYTDTKVSAAQTYLSNSISTLQDTTNSSISTLQTQHNKDIANINTSISDTKTTINNRIDSIKTQVDETVADANSRMDTLDAKVDETVSKVNEDINKATSTVQDQINQTRNDLEVKYADYTNAYDKKLEELESSVNAEIESSKTYADGVIDGVEDKIKSTITELNDHVYTFQTSMESELSSTKTAIETELSDTQAELDAQITSTKESLEGKITDLDTTVSNNISDLESEYTRQIGEWRSYFTQEVDTESEKLQTQLDETTTSLETKISDLDTSVSTKISDLDTKLSTEISDTDTKLSTAISDLDTKQSTAISDLDTKTTTAVSDLDTKLSNSVSELDTRLTKSVSDLDEKQTKAISDLDTKQTTAISDLDTKTTTAVTELDERLTKSVSDTDTKLTTAISDLDTKQTKAIEDLDEKQSKAISDLDEKTTKAVSDTDTKLTTLVTETDTKLTNSITELDERQTKAISDLDTKQSQAISDLDDKTTTAISDTDTKLTKLVTDTDTKLTTAITDLDTKQTKAINDLDDKQTKAVGDLDTKLTKNISDVDTELTSQVESLNTTLSKAIDDLDTELSKKIDDTDKALSDSIASTKSELETSLSDTSTELSGKITDLRGTYEGSISDLDTKIAGDISTAEDTLNTKIEDLTSRIQSSQSDANSIQGILAAAMSGEDTVATVNTRGSTLQLIAGKNNVPTIDPFKSETDDSGEFVTYTFAVTENETYGLALRVSNTAVSHYVTTNTGLTLDGELESFTTTADQYENGYILGDEITIPPGVTTISVKSYNNPILADSQMVALANITDVSNAWISQINLGNGTITLDGKFINITGDTVFSEDATIKGTMTAGSVDIADSNVLLDSDGLAISLENGSTIKYDAEGQHYVDSNGNSFAGVGRFAIGTCKNDQEIVFATPWDVTPTVLMIPMQYGFVTGNVDTAYSEVRCFPAQVTKSGFLAKIYSVVSNFSSLLASTLTTTSDCSKSYSATAADDATTLTAITASQTANSADHIAGIYDMSYRAQRTVSKTTETRSKIPKTGISYTTCGELYLSADDLAILKSYKDQGYKVVTTPNKVIDSDTMEYVADLLAIVFNDDDALAGTNIEQDSNGQYHYGPMNTAYAYFGDNVYKYASADTAFKSLLTDAGAKSWIYNDSNTVTKNSTAEVTESVSKTVTMNLYYDLTGADANVVAGTLLDTKTFEASDGTGVITDSLDVDLPTDNGSGGILKMVATMDVGENDFAGAYSDAKETYSIYNGTTYSSSSYNVGKGTTFRGRTCDYIIQLYNESTKDRVYVRTASGATGDLVGKCIGVDIYVGKFAIYANNFSTWYNTTRFESEFEAKYTWKREYVKPTEYSYALTNLNPAAITQSSSSDSSVIGGTAMYFVTDAPYTGSIPDMSYAEKLTEISNLRAQNATLTSEKETLEEENATLTSEKETLEEENATLTSENETLNSNLDSVAADLDSIDSDTVTILGEE